MDTQKQEGMQADGAGDESLNTSSAGNQAASEGTPHSGHRKGGIHNNALYAAGMGRPATAQVDPHSNRGLANTGTNISYEGPTAAGAGGSAGTGYTSGQSGAGSSISSDSDYDQAAIGKRFGRAEGEDHITDAQADEAEDEINEQR
jgi:hypothetical protein